MSRNPMDFPLSPQEVGALKSRLAADPHDEAARRELVAWYRRGGHNDQAGRYAVAVEGLATEPELRAYASMLRSLGAEGNRMREFSRLPDDPETHARVTRELHEQHALSERLGPSALLESIAWILWVTFALAVLATLITTFVLALSGNRQVHEVTTILSAISLFIATVAFGICAIYSVSERSRIAPVVLVVLCAAAATGAVMLLAG